MWLPFICLAAGALLAKFLHRFADRLMQFSLFALLLGLGARIGADDKLLAAVPALGAKALIICMLAAAGSILLVLLWEKLFLNGRLNNQNASHDQHQSSFSHEYLFILTVVLFLALGIGLGHYVSLPGHMVSGFIAIALVAVYLSVGVGLKDGAAGLKSNPNKLAYLVIPLLIMAGSVGGGLLGALLLGIAPPIAGGIGGGMGYYSLAAAMVTQKAGIEYGFIAFLANFIREVITFFLTPFLARVSSLAVIGLGGATTMDTTLAVMKRCLGKEYVTLSFISGVIITLLVPFLLMFMLSF